ncbi:hypothetical protein N6H14_20965 [Paenibacillus sp. CC-CFT747]|nr:hypothetical protein N6H14_20965 [Paenibacillus sp. CC-CFT747]
MKTFDAYVERTIVIPSGVDPSQITTGVVILPDGRAGHVPTKVTKANGKVMAVLNSLTNSTYSVISNKKTFEDISTHWAKASVENLAARLVISGSSERSSCRTMRLPEANLRLFLPGH